MPNQTARWIALGVSSVALLGSLFFITYFLQRHETFPLLLAYTLAFATYLVSVLSVVSKKAVYFLLGVAIIGRLFLLPALPNLSDDIYRFVWDGRLLEQGVNPFAYLPSELINRKADSLNIEVDTKLFNSLNSPDYHTIYPPVNQAAFTLAVYLFPDSLKANTIFIRLLILLAELGTLWLLFRLVKLYQVPEKQVLWYALNPLVILELSGNLHFEALMIFFLLASVYLLEKQRWILSALLFALAVCTKLLPLIFLPLYIRRLGWQKAFWYYAIIGLTTLLLFLPLLSSELIQGLTESVGLYFQKFEFNASIYYLVREIGYIRKGYNIIQTAGWQLALTAFLLILTYAFLERKKLLIGAFGWVWLIYLLLSLTVHPWYIIPLVVFSVFTPYRYAVVWTFFIFLTYAGYTATGFQEILWLVFLEYAMVLGWLGYELYRYRKKLTFASRILTFKAK